MSRIKVGVGKDAFVRHDAINSSFLIRSIQKGPFKGRESSFFFLVWSFNGDIFGSPVDKDLL